MMTVGIITTGDDLHRLVDEINRAQWDEANEMSDFDVEALSAYLAHQDTRFVACHEVIGADRSLCGIASSRLQPRPHSKIRWLYVDEVDVCVDQRQKGAGKAMMRKLIEIARDAGCQELWLGTEPDNDAANALYRSLDPDTAEQFIGYTYKFQDQASTC